MSLSFPQRLQSDQAREVLDRLTRELVPAQTQAVSLAELQTFDSSALAVMLALQRSAKAMAGQVAWRDVPPRMQALAQLYGVDALLGMGQASS